MSGPTDNEQRELLKGTKLIARCAEVDFCHFKLKKCHEFSVKRREDEHKINPRGILVLHDKIVITDDDNLKFKLFDSRGHYLSYTNIEQCQFGITNVDSEDNFATLEDCEKICVWTIHDKTIVRTGETFDVDVKAYGIHFNNTYYCVLHQPHSVTILDKQGRQIRKIVIKQAFGKDVTFGFDILMDKDTHNIYVPCWTPKGLLCISMMGEVLWFTPLTKATTQGITEVIGVLCVADSWNRCLHLISRSGQYIRRLLEKDSDGTPEHVHFDGLGQKLYVSHYFGSKKNDIISVYSLKFNKEKRCALM